MTRMWSFDPSCLAYPQAWPIFREKSFRQRGCGSPTLHRKPGSPQSVKSVQPVLIVGVLTEQTCPPIGPIGPIAQSIVFFSTPGFSRTPAFTILSTGHPLASLWSAILDLAATMDHEKPMDTWAAWLPAALTKKPALPNKGSVRQSDPMGSRNPNEGNRNRSHRSGWHCTSSKRARIPGSFCALFKKGNSASGRSFYLSGKTWYVHHLISPKCWRVAEKNSHGITF